MKKFMVVMMVMVMSMIACTGCMVTDAAESVINKTETKTGYTIIDVTDFEDSYEINAVIENATFEEFDSLVREYASDDEYCSMVLNCVDGEWEETWGIYGTLYAFIYDWHGYSRMVMLVTFDPTTFLNTIKEA